MHGETIKDLSVWSFWSVCLLLTDTYWRKMVQIL